MANSSRATLIKVHVILAAFVFPAALMFIVTGAFYTWGIKGSYDSQSHVIALEQPLQGDQQRMSTLVERELAQRSIAVPSGQSKIKKAGTSYQLEWTGSKRDVLLEPTADALQAKLTIKETTWYRNLVQLHKAKGGQAFKVFAAILAIALFLILLSGFIMAWQMPNYRKLAAVFTSAGVVAFVVMVGLS
jgi:hypothetical protein